MLLLLLWLQTELDEKKFCYQYNLTTTSYKIVNFKKICDYFYFVWLIKAQNVNKSFLLNLKKQDPIQVQLMACYGPVTWAWHKQ